MKPSQVLDHQADLPCPLCHGGGFDTAAVFAEAMKKTEVTAGGCWLRGQPGAYPVMSWRKQSIALHQFALALTLGRWPVGMACHTCDVSECWNPAHLYEGNALTNNTDRRTRAKVYGRQGEENHFARLTMAGVLEIRAAADERGMLTRVRAAEFAARYGVQQNTIYRAFTGQTWRDDTRVKPEPREHYAVRSARQ